MIATKIKCLAPWGGSKRTLTPRIDRLLGPHGTYFEPFVGGGAVILGKEPAKNEFINDANPWLINVYRCVKSHCGQLQEFLARRKFDKAEFLAAYQSVEGHKSRSVLPEGTLQRIMLAADQLTVWWMGPNGLAGTTTKPWFATRHTNTGGSPVTRWNSFRQSLPAMAERLQNVEIFNEDFRMLFARLPWELDGIRSPWDLDGVAIYCDPPYFKKAFDYEFEDDIQPDGTRKPFPHEQLAAVLNQFCRARVVVSYYDERDEPGLFGGGSRLDELYPPDRWERHEVKLSKASANARTSATKTTATEVLLVNRRGT